MFTMNRNIKLLRQAWEGVDFVMEMFEPEYRFPRKVFTGASRKQYSVDSRDRAMMYFEAALYEDCYMNAYPDYDAMKEKGNLLPTFRPPPNHIMIDLDRAPFSSDEEYDLALAATCKNIKASVTGISGEHPIVIASGSGGCHVHVPLLGLKTSFQDMPEFEASKDDSDLDNKFLRFAERKLSNNKADHCHNPSIKSCLFRVPGTINTKTKAVVKVVEGYRHINGRISKEELLPKACKDVEASKPTTKFLNDFYAYLIQLQINDKIVKSDRQLKSLEAGFRTGNPNSIWWIEKLLSTGVEDGRKDLLFWVLAPYLISIRRLDHDKAVDILESWLDKCNAVSSLNYGRSYFSRRIEYCISSAEHQNRLPIRLGTFGEYYPELYRRLFS